MTEELNIRQGVLKDIPELVRLYEETVEHLESHVNYPGWKKASIRERLRPKRA